MAIELAQRAMAILGEGPCWNPALGIITWVDIPRGRMHRLDPATGEATARDFDAAVGAALPAENGVTVLCTDTGFWAVAPDSEPVLIVAVEADQPGRRMNDAKADPRGRVWGGTIALDLTRGAGALWRLDQGRAERVLTGLDIPNGLDWSPDGTGMWLVDSFAEVAACYRYDLETGDIGDVIASIPLPAEGGFGDGLTVDAEGGVWIARFGGWAVERYWPDGSLAERIEVPVSHPTSCAFGGVDLKTLYITTARSDENGPRSDQAIADQPLAGSLLSVRTSVAGRAPSLAAN
jgi:sugar lactone lactonase YvrE